MASAEATKSVARMGSATRWNSVKGQQEGDLLRSATMRDQFPEHWFTFLARQHVAVGAFAPTRHKPLPVAAEAWLAFRRCRRERGTLGGEKVHASLFPDVEAHQRNAGAVPLPRL